MTLTSDYQEQLHERLQDREYAAEYLSACASEGQEALLVGLKDVAKAQGGVGQLAKETALNRESLYRMLSDEGNPTLESVLLVLDSLGIELQFAMRAAS